MTALRRLTPEDLPRLRRFWLEHWGGDEMIVHGETFHPGELEGFVADDWSGLVTYIVRGAECEVISLDSLREGRGTGGNLLQMVVDEARQRGCRRLVLSSTNANLKALGFYQRRGFALVGLRPGAITESRKQKPGIPEMDENGIPLRDEIDLELML